MDEGGSDVDEACRRRFEAHRIAGGGDALALFLPPATSPAFAATLEELVAIDMEVRWKAWREGAPAPRAGDWDTDTAPLDAAARARLLAECERLAARFARTVRLEPGTRLSHYVLSARAGRGAHAEVWRAFDERLRRDVAVKIARPELAGEPGIVSRLVREAHSAARLRHPGIVTVHEVGEFAGQPYIVSDFVAGDTLAEAMAKRRFDADAAARIVMDLAEALAYAHDCGVVHRDVKPGNVLLEGGRRAVLADFGLAHLLAADVALTRHGEVVGTPAYMAPEQARGASSEPGPACDVYSLGVVLYELVAGRRPFERATAESTLFAVVHEDPAPLRETAPGASIDLVTIVERAMAREPAARYPSARALAEDLRRLLDRMPILARPIGPLARAALWARRNPAFAATIAASVAALVVVSWVGLDGVLAERRRFRSERDRANENLYRARVAEADAQLRARDSEWFARTIDAAREAAALDVPVRDARALRDLVLRAHSQHAPSFHPVARWPAEPGTAIALAASPSGGAVAGIGDDGSVWLREVPSGRRIARVSLAEARPRRIAYLGADGIIVGCGDGSLRILRADTLEPLRPPRAGGASVEALAFAPDQGSLAVGRASGAIEVFAVFPGTCELSAAPRRFDAHAGGVTALAFAKDGTRLASGGMDCAIRVWPTGGGDPVADERVSDPPRALEFSAIEDQLAWCTFEAGWGLLHLAPKVIATSHHGVHLAAVRGVAFVGPETVVTSSADETMRAFHVGGEPLTLARTDAGPITASVVVPGTPRIVAAHAGGGVTVWDVAEPPGRTIYVTPHASRFVPGTARLATGMEVLDLASPFRGTPQPSPQVWGVAASPDGRLVATTDHAGAVVVRDAGTFALVRELASGGGPAWTAAFSPDSRTLAAGVAGDVVLFDVASGRETARVATGSDLVTGLVFHPTAPLLAVAAMDGGLRVLPTDVPRELREIARSAALHEVAFSPDGARLAAACGDGNVRVWTGPLAAPRAPDAVVPSGGGAVWAVAFDRQGRYLASGTERGVVLLHDAASFASLATFACEVRRVRTLSFDDSGRYLAAGCYSSRSIVWDLPALRSALASMSLDW